MKNIIASLGATLLLVTVLSAQALDMGAIVKAQVILGQVT